MDSRALNILGLIFCLILFCSGFWINGNTGFYLNLSGLLIVLGGVFGATILSFRMERLLILVKVLKTTYTMPVKRPVEIVGLLLDLSFKKKVRGIQ